MEIISEVMQTIFDRMGKEFTERNEAYTEIQSCMADLNLLESISEEEAMERFSCDTKEEYRICLIQELDYWKKRYKNLGGVEEV